MGTGAGRATPACRRAMRPGAERPRRPRPAGSSPPRRQGSAPASRASATRRGGCRRRCRARTGGCRRPPGSVSKTSSPAAPRRPLRSATTSAASSTSPPRAVLTRIAPGFMRAIAPALMICAVSGARGTCSDTTSLEPSSASSGMRSPTAPGFELRLAYSTRAPMACSIGARRRGTAPYPTSPTVRPHTSPAWSWNAGGRFQPARASASRRFARRRAPSISSRVISATAWVFAPGMLQTATPPRRAASRSMVFTPTPIF